MLQFDDAGQITPEAAAAVAAAFQPRSEFSTTEVPQFGDVGPAALSEIDIQRAFAQAEAERLAFERNFGPIVEQEQLAAAQRQFNQDFGPLAEQEIADTRNRQRAQFEQDFGRFEAEAEQERLTEERRAREQFEREYNVGQRRNLTAEQIAQERADAEGFMVGGSGGVDRSGLSESDWAILLNSTGYNFKGPLEGTLGGFVDRVGDTVGGAIDVVGSAVDSAGDAIVDAAEWGIEASLDLTYMPRTPLTRKIETGVTLTSGGDPPRSLGGGVTVIENVTGAALEFLNAVGKEAFTVGKTIFVRGTLPETRGLREHELRHVRQYEVLGDAFWPIYLAGLLAKGASENPLEKDARDAATKTLQDAAEKTENSE